MGLRAAEFRNLEALRFGLRGFEVDSEVWDVVGFTGRV